jgi:hypothetical protein
MKRIEFIREQLARHALAVCQTYLSNGRRKGQYWVVGDIDGNPGRSLYIRLTGRAGKWTDSATGEHGDLLDIIAHAGRHNSFSDTLSEAQHFLSLPAPLNTEPVHAVRGPDRTSAARRLFAASQPIQGTTAGHYLHARGLTDLLQYDALRFHPNCYGQSGSSHRYAYPALIAAITDLRGDITGVHRTWLSLHEPAKAPISEPKRSLGRMMGHGVRFGGTATDVLLAGEGLETVLSLHSLLPWIPAVAALTATHLGLLELPSTLERIYIARDNDQAGLTAWNTLSTKAITLGVQPLPLIPRLKDWNDDLLCLGRDQALTLARSQLDSIDAAGRTTCSP